MHGITTKGNDISALKQWKNRFVQINFVANEIIGIIERAQIAVLIGTRNKPQRP